VARCQWCHGARGEGNDERLVPRVAGQQYEYLLRQLHDAMEARRPNMRVQHLRLLEACSMEELMGLASYMSRLDRTPGQ
jgi:cytochrome c553